MIKVQGNGWTAELSVSENPSMGFRVPTTDKKIAEFVQMDLQARVDYKTGVWVTDMEFSWLIDMVGMRGIAWTAEGPEATDPRMPTAVVSDTTVVTVEFEVPAIQSDEEAYQAEVAANSERHVARIEAEFKEIEMTTYTQEYIEAHTRTTDAEEWATFDNAHEAWEWRNTKYARRAKATPAEIQKVEQVQAAAAKSAAFWANRR